MVRVSTTVTCVICSRVQPVEKMDGRRCISKRGCYTIAAIRMRAKPLSKRAERILKYGEDAAEKKRAA